MPRQRTRHRRAVRSYLDGFPESLERLKEATGLSWAELARRIGTDTLTLRRWRGGVRPNSQHLLALMDLAGEMDLSDILTAGIYPSQSQDRQTAQD